MELTILKENKQEFEEAIAKSYLEKRPTFIEEKDIFVKYDITGIRPQDLFFLGAMYQSKCALKHIY